jgi:hypothetical protein
VRQRSQLTVEIQVQLIRAMVKEIDAGGQPQGGNT